MKFTEYDASIEYDAMRGTFQEWLGLKLVSLEFENIEDEQDVEGTNFAKQKRRKLEKQLRILVKTFYPCRGENGFLETDLTGFDNHQSLQ